MKSGPRLVGGGMKSEPRLGLMAWDWMWGWWVWSGQALAWDWMWDWWVSEQAWD
jgi:hypothetical protein